MLRSTLLSLFFFGNIFRSAMVYANQGMGSPRPPMVGCEPERHWNFIWPPVNPCIHTEAGAGSCCACMWRDSLLARNYEAAERQALYDLDPEAYEKKYQREERPPNPLELTIYDPVPMEAIEAHLMTLGKQAVISQKLLDHYFVIRYTCQLTVTDEEAESLLPWTKNPRKALAKYAMRFTPAYLVQCARRDSLVIKLESPSARKYAVNDPRNKGPKPTVTSARCVSHEEYRRLHQFYGFAPELLTESDEFQQKTSEDDPDAALKQALLVQRVKHRFRAKEYRMRSRKRQLQQVALSRVQEGPQCLEIPQLQVADSTNDAAIIPEYDPGPTTIEGEPASKRRLQLVVGVIDSSVSDARIDALNTAFRGAGYFETFANPTADMDSDRYLDIPLPFDEALNAAHWTDTASEEAKIEMMPQAFINLLHTSTDSLGLSNTRALELDQSQGIRSDQVVVDTTLWSNMPTESSQQSNQQDRLEACFTPVFPGSLENTDAYYGFQDNALPPP